MILGIILLVVLIMFMLAGAIPVMGGAQVSIFHTPFFILLMSALAVSALVCCWKRRKISLPNTGFLLTHLGIIVILAGALTGFLCAKNSQFALPISGGHEIRQLPTAVEDVYYDLDFGITVTDFKVDFYGQAGKMADPTPKHYQASLKITGKDGSTTQHELVVNHPVVHDGWRFFLMSYDKESRRYVVLSARNDPGRNIVFSGIAMLMLGISITCFRKAGGNNGTV